MFKNIITPFLLLLLMLKSIVSFGQMSLSKDVKVSVLTCGKGNELYSIYGHTALRIKDDTNSLDIIYNYGMFDFRTENFYLKFIKGDLKYFASAYNYNEFYYEYTLENRSIYEQELNLSQAQKQQLFDNLNATLFSDKKYYTYKFIDRNCTSKVMDEINEAVGQKCILKTVNLDKTYREVLFDYQENLFYENLGINIMFGKKVDNLCEKLFLPTELLESLKAAKINNQPLSGAPKLILTGAERATPLSLWNNFYTFCAFFILILISRKNWIYLSLLAVLGLFGLFLSVVGLYSFHEEVAYNYNTLLLNPTFLLLLYFYWTKKYKWFNYICFVNVILLVVYIVILVSKPNLWMFSPMILTSAILLIHFYKWSKKKIKLA
jgi:hypothetical protein